MFKGSAERMHKLLDAEKFNVVVDEKHKTGKRRQLKVSQERPSIFGSSPSAINDSNIYGSN